MNDQEVELIRSRFSITEDDFELMYKQAELLTFSGVKPAEGRPTAVFTGGQPGAGKTGIVLMTKQEHEKRGSDVISFDLDFYRSFYKNAGIIARDYPALYADITGKYAGKIMERLSEKAINERYNFILEGTMGKSTYTLDLLKEKNTDFNIIARLMATSKEESLLSVFERYIEMRKRMGVGRLTTVSSHNNKYDSFTDTASRLENKGIEVEVYERSINSEDIARPIMIYKTSSKVNLYSSAERALQAGRNNSRKICLKKANERLKSIKNDIELYKDDEGLLIEFKKAEAIIKQELEVSI